MLKHPVSACEEAERASGAVCLLLVQGSNAWKDLALEQLQRGTACMVRGGTMLVTVKDWKCGEREKGVNHVTE